MKEKEISKKYELLDEIQHVLKRPGMYIGSTKPHQSSEYFLEGDKFEMLSKLGFPVDVASILISLSLRPKNAILLACLVKVSFNIASVL